MALDNHGVLIRPGMIGLALIPYFAPMLVMSWVSVFTPAFDTLYAIKGHETIAAIEETFTIAPPRCHRITGKTCLHVSAMPLRLVSMMLLAGGQ